MGYLSYIKNTTFKKKVSCNMLVYFHYHVFSWNKYLYNSDTCALIPLKACIFIINHTCFYRYQCTSITII